MKKLTLAFFMISFLFLFSTAYALLIITYPANDYDEVSPNFTLVWSEVPGATTYLVTLLGDGTTNELPASQICVDSVCSCNFSVASSPPSEIPLGNQTIRVEGWHGDYEDYCYADRILSVVEIPEFTEQELLYFNTLMGLAGLMSGCLLFYGIMSAYLN